MSIRAFVNCVQVNRGDTPPQCQFCAVGVIASHKAMMLAYPPLMHPSPFAPMAPFPHPLHLQGCAHYGPSPVQLCSNSRPSGSSVIKSNEQKSSSFSIASILSKDDKVRATCTAATAPPTVEVKPPSAFYYMYPPSVFSFTSPAARCMDDGLHSTPAIPSPLAVISDIVRTSGKCLCHCVYCSFYPSGYRNHS